MTDPLARLDATLGSGTRTGARRRLIDVPPALVELAAGQLGLLTRRQCVAAGMPPGRIDRLTARGDWRVITRGVLLVDPGAVPRGDWGARARQRALVAALAGGPDVVVVGLGALALGGVHGLPLHYVPEFTSMSGVHLRSSAQARARRLERHAAIDGHPKLVQVGGVTIAGPLWALSQGLPGMDREHAVAVVDSALQVGAISASALPVLTDLLAGSRGVRSLRRWLTLVDGRAESPLETRARLECHDAGVPPDDLQRVVLDARGRFIGRCDMVWELGGGRLLVIEMDGGHHRRDGQIDIDNARDNSLTRAAHVVYHYGWRHLGTHVIAATVRDELSRAGRGA